MESNNDPYPTLRKVRLGEIWRIVIDGAKSDWQCAKNDFSNGVKTGEFGDGLNSSYILFMSYLSIPVSMMRNAGAALCGSMLKLNDRLTTIRLLQTQGPGRMWPMLRKLAVWSACGGVLYLGMSAGLPLYQVDLMARRFLLFAAFMGILAPWSGPSSLAAFMLRRVRRDALLDGPGVKRTLEIRGMSGEDPDKALALHALCRRADRESVRLIAYVNLERPLRERDLLEQRGFREFGRTRFSILMQPTALMVRTPNPELAVQPTKSRQSLIDLFARPVPQAAFSPELVSSPLTAVPSHRPALPRAMSLEL